MIVLLDAVKLFERIAFEGIEITRHSDVYRAFLNIVRNHAETTIAVPYWTLFEEIEYIDYVLHDKMPHGNPVYDTSLQAFVFKSAYHMFHSIPHIVQTIHKHFPNNHSMTLRHLAITRAMALLGEEGGAESELDELCGLMDKI
jgi:hypothetical protein